MMKRRVLCLLLGLLLALPARPVRAEEGLTAYAFFQQYGGNRLISLGHELYFATRLKKATVYGYRYRTMGYRFTVQGFDSLRADLALGQSVSLYHTEEVTEGGLTYHYSLYRLTMESLQQRLRESCGASLERSLGLVRRPVYFTVDSVMTIFMQGQDPGVAREMPDGTLEGDTPLYYTEAEMWCHDWAGGTDFSASFNILLTLQLRKDPELLQLRHIGRDYLFTLEPWSLWRTGSKGNLLDSLQEGEP